MGQQSNNYYAIILVQPHLYRGYIIFQLVKFVMWKMNWWRWYESTDSESITLRIIGIYNTLYYNNHHVTTDCFIREYLIYLRPMVKLLYMVILFCIAIYIATGVDPNVPLNMNHWPKKWPSIIISFNGCTYSFTHYSTVTEKYIKRSETIISYN